MGKEILDRIFVGTSGWKYDDWIGKFYPEDIPKNRLLQYYSTYFRTVEVNFSYYIMPNRYTLSAIARNVPRDFVFTIKLNSVFTHQKDLLNPYLEVPLKERDEFLRAVEVMRSEGKVDTLLAQFPQSFRFSTRNLEYITKLGRAFSGFNLAVEFRSKDWYNGVVYEVFKRENLTFVSVDEPEIPVLPPRELIVTNRIGYIRLHSRDASKWYGGEKLRYDYYYQDCELMEWIDKIKASWGFEKLYVFFNNCHNGQAAENALRFKKLVSVELM